MRAFYTDHFVLPLPARHRFPMAKYGRLREQLEGSAPAGLELLVPAAATREELLRVHDRAYVEAVFEGSLDRAAVRRIGFPWSPEMVERSRRSVGATIAACRAAAEDGVSVNLAGGTHHAGIGHGEGYCVFNDTAVAARAMQAEDRAERVLVIDCDVHQGNGTAEIFANDPTVFTLDVFGALNYPFTKTPADLDVPLPDGTGDDAYIGALTTSLDRVMALHTWDLAIYVSGADPYVDDTLGRLALTKDGLSRRDEIVIGRCRDRDVPIAITMAGGYAPHTQDIVDIHLTTILTAMQMQTSITEPIA